MLDGHLTLQQFVDFTGRDLTCMCGAILLAALLTGCSKTSPAKTAAPVDVVVTTPITDMVTDFADFTGRLDATRTVEVRARVTGYLNEVPFKEGDLVKEGDLLFQVDPRTYVADFNQAVANVRLAEAEQNVQEHNAKRARELYAKKAIGDEEYETIVATWEKAKATVKAMAAAQERAKQYLDFTRVTSSVNGRISRRYADPGNLVKGDDTLLTTIVTEDPIYAYFDVDERTYLDLAGSSIRETQSWLAGRQHQVLMRLANEDEFTHSGAVDFVDNRLNGNSGTIRMRGVFENPNHILKSGLFVRIRLPIAAPYLATLIPDEAVQSDQGRKFVYVVNDKNQVEYKAVTLGQSLQGLRVIKQGLSKADHVIISGMQRVRPNTEVNVKMQDPPKPPGSPLTKMLLNGKSAPRENNDATKAADKGAKLGSGSAANEN
jgi:membrane fusion protein, multidrug efflux system